MSTQMLKVTTETEINDVRRQVGRIFHVNATVFKNPLNCIGYISFMQAWFYGGNGNDCTLIASP
jgi:hypothetical protein